MELIFSAILGFLSCELLTVYGKVPENIAQMSGWLIFFAFLWLSDHISPIKEFKKFKGRKNDEIAQLKEQNALLKQLLKQKEEEKEDIIKHEKELNFFKKKD